MGSKLGPTIEDYAREEGRLLTSRANLLLFLEARCEAVPESIVARINSCEDVTVLQAWMRQAARINSIDEFRPE